MPIDELLERRLRGRLEHLYGDRAAGCLEKILARAGQLAPTLPAPRKTQWDQRDVVLITSADQVRRRGIPPLAALREFLTTYGLERLLSTVDLLPFFPYSSDDGFSVIDYYQVDPALGDWDDVGALGEDFGLMFDLVLNHVSRHSRWFKQWTTFSEDQIDLNFAEPEVLLQMIDVLLFYLQHGARFLRLDAIGYLWKQSGTCCVNLPQVGLLRESVDGRQKILVLCNLGRRPQTVDVASRLGETPVADLLADSPAGNPVRLAPYHVAWLEL